MSFINSVQIETLRESLSNNGRVLVTFEKADGSLRNMECVLTPEVVGQTYDFNDSIGSGQSRQENPDLQLVWDISENAWRNFRYSNVTEFSLVNNC